MGGATEDGVNELVSSVKDLKDQVLRSLKSHHPQLEKGITEKQVNTMKRIKICITRDQAND